MTKVNLGEYEALHFNEDAVHIIFLNKGVKFMGLFKKKNKEVFQQNTAEKIDFQNVYMMHLLFEEKPIKPNPDVIKSALIRKFGEVDTVSNNKELTSFAIRKYSAQFKEGSLPPQVVMAEVHEFNQDSIDEFSRSQFWDIYDGNAVLNQCKYELFIFDLMASVMEYKERCELLMDWLEVAVELFPECRAVWVKPAGKLFDADKIREGGIPRENRFVYYGVNARFFNIENSNDQIVDTLGLYAIGLPDIQYHFHDLDPNHVVNHAYNVASYIYDKNAPIENGETIDGIENGVMDANIRWNCQYEDSLIQPGRVVLDVCPGEFASGGRTNE